MGDNDDQQRDNARLMLPLHHERNNQLANMLIALNGFMLAFMAGLIAFIGSTYFTTSSCILHCSKELCQCVEISRDPLPIILAINIAIAIMILWRFYAHYIDNDIISGYKKIITLEDLNNKDTHAIEIISTSLRYQFDRDKNDKIKNSSVNEINFGPRGHHIFDILTFLSCISLIIAEFFIINDYKILIERMPFFSVSLIIIGLIGGICWKFRKIPLDDTITTIIVIIFYLISVVLCCSFMVVK